MPDSTSTETCMLMTVPINFDKINTIQYIDFRATGTISIGAGRGDENRNTATVNFDSDVLKAQAMLKWWKLNYSGGDEHYKDGRVKITNITKNGPSVTVEVSGLIADGNYDNGWNGEVQVVVIAIVQDPPPLS